MDADGGNPVNLTRDGAYDSAPAWSPDGQRIAFERNGGGGRGPQVFVMNADGSGVEWLTQEPLASWGRSPAWSPDGASIAYDGEDGISIMDPAGGGTERVSPEGQYAGQPSWSPDGVWIAYVALDPDDLDISHLWVMAADGSGARQLTFAEAWDETPTWSPDGTPHRLRPAGRRGDALRHLHRPRRGRRRGAGDRRSVRRPAPELDALLRCPERERR